MLTRFRKWRLSLVQQKISKLRDEFQMEYPLALPGRFLIVKEKEVWPLLRRANQLRKKLGQV